MWFGWSPGQHSKMSSEWGGSGLVGGLWLGGGIVIVYRAQD